MAAPVSLSVAVGIMLSDGIWIDLAPNSLTAVIDPAFVDAQTGQLIVPGEGWMQFVDVGGQVYAAPMRCVCGVKLAVAVTPGTVSVTDPGDQSGPAGTPVSLQIAASDSVVGQSLTYVADGLPPGLAIGQGTGLITGTPNIAGTYSVTVTAEDSANSIGSASFNWVIT